MAHVDYATSKKNVVKGLIILAAITLVEVGLSLYFPNVFGKILILILSIYKAYFIMYKFMHLGDEVKGLRIAIVLPFILLIWGMIAFLQEGNAWNENRSNILDAVKTEKYNHLDDPTPVHDTHGSHDAHGTHDTHSDHNDTKHEDATHEDAHH